ncbi:hypothetical protein [Methylorubrum populi]|uniref:Uncharacterized protein n=1 Tax=Methylorubrum populi TaxID=223967 RepID=A0A833N209_9HYPH|nr:hypothetical protein [Methylorubrum populi]KAB7788066.1 hypothetical protein F8B43_0071 [Methylorubrum populi]
MTAIYYDDNDDRIIIVGALQTYAPRTLRAVFDAAGQIMVRLKVRASNEFGPFPYSDLMDANGQGFADRMAAMAYLNSVFGRRPSYAGVERVIADEDLGGHRVVRISGAGRAAYASCADAEHAEFVIGMTRTAIASGARGLVSTQGVVEEPSWAWELGPLFLGLSGLLTPNPPTSGFVLRVATVVTPTRIMLVHDEPYLLAS